MILKLQCPKSQVLSNPDDPGQVIRDPKTMIQAYRNRHIMDVKFTTILLNGAPFQTTVWLLLSYVNPDGTSKNGTGGNEVSEHEMYRK